MRKAVRALGAGEAHQALAREDPAAASRIRTGDTARAQRALEVVRATGRALQDWQAEKVGGIADRVALRPLILLPARDWLHARCDERLEKIFSDEGIDEVRLLLERRLPALAPVMRAIGVREIAALLRGETSPEHEAGGGADRHPPICQAPIYLVPAAAAGRVAAVRGCVDCDALPDALALIGV